MSSSLHYRFQLQLSLSIITVSVPIACYKTSLLITTFNPYILGGKKENISYCLSSGTTPLFMHLFKHFYLRTHKINTKFFLQKPMIHRV